MQQSSIISGKVAFRHKVPFARCLALACLYIGTERGSYSRKYIVPRYEVWVSVQSAWTGGFPITRSHKHLPNGANKPAPLPSAHQVRASHTISPYEASQSQGIYKIHIRLSRILRHPDSGEPRRL